MSETDPDPREPDEGFGTSVLGGHQAPDAGDPTDGGKHGQVGDAPSIRSDEPESGGYPVGGGSVAEESDAPSVADPGSEA